MRAVNFSSKAGIYISARFSYFPAAFCFIWIESSDHVASIFVGTKTLSFWVSHPHLTAVHFVYFQWKWVFSVIEHIRTWPLPLPFDLTALKYASVDLIILHILRSHFLRAVWAYAKSEEVSATDPNILWIFFGLHRVAHSKYAVYHRQSTWNGKYFMQRCVVYRSICATNVHERVDVHCIVSPQHIRKPWKLHASKSAHGTHSMKKSLKIVLHVRCTCARIWR